jgi:uncharacterized protein YciI
MQFHVRLIDGPSKHQTRLDGREAHWQYLDDHAEHFYGRGPTFLGSMDTFLSTIFFLEFADWDAVNRFITEEPHYRNGVYQDVSIWRWQDELGRRQRDFPRRDGPNWYLRGFARPDADRERSQLAGAHAEYCASFDRRDFIVRGSIVDAEGKSWQGSAALIALPSREAVDAFLGEEPYYRAGLYSDMLIEQFKFGGRPGQVT